jgi:hypothetical protein
MMTLRFRLVMQPYNPLGISIRSRISSSTRIVLLSSSIDTRNYMKYSPHSSRATATSCNRSPSRKPMYPSTPALRMRNSLSPGPHRSRRVKIRPQTLPSTPASRPPIHVFILIIYRVAVREGESDDHSLSSDTLYVKKYNFKNSKYCNT